MQFFPADLSICAIWEMRESRRTNGAPLKNHAQTKLVFPGQNPGFTLKATGPSFFPQPVQRYPGNTLTSL